MSIFSSIVKGISGAVAGFATGGPIGAVLGGVGAFVPPPAAAPGAGFGGAPVQAFATQVRGARLPALPRFPGTPPALPGIPIPIPGFGGDTGGACPAGFHLDKRTRSRCVRNRRMNPLNGRAAMRAIRRVKGARKMLQKIERQLPKSKTRAVPRHGHHVKVHST